MEAKHYRYEAGIAPALHDVSSAVFENQIAGDTLQGLIDYSPNQE